MTGSSAPGDVMAGREVGVCIPPVGKHRDWVREKKEIKQGKIQGLKAFTAEGFS
jgi:hypothetical protein